MTRFRVSSLGFLFLWAATAQAAPPSPYVDGKHGKGEVKHVNGLPVLIVEGTPEEIGEQTAALTHKPVKRLLGFPKEYLKHFGFEAAWPTLVKMSNAMTPRFPEDHLKELESLVKRAEVDRELAIVGNTFADIKKIGGCSALIIEPDRSAVQGPLFGRNLDYPTLGFLHEYSLVIVCRPKGKHAFASVGFPGFVGCLSGMNDVGLAVAVLEVHGSKDGSLPFDPEGTPYALCYRRILEECSTVAEAEKLLRSMKRTTRNNLAVCDLKGGAIFEITPKNVVVRRPENGVCSCTNHFRSKELATKTQCRRYGVLEKVQDLPKVEVANLSKLLHEVNQGENTLQTMIFEPAALKLHLSIGEGPSSARPLKVLELKALFEKQ